MEKLFYIFQETPDNSILDTHEHLKTCEYLLGNCKHKKKHKSKETRNKILVSN